MDRFSDQLVDLKLASECHPVANYSHPRKGSTSTIATGSSSSSYSRCSSNTTNSSQDRESLDSEESAPGLVEDRDSEVSLDDDDQYHVQTSELWDSFWPPRSSSRPDRSSSLTHKRYPSLVLPPHAKKQPLGQGAKELPPPPTDRSSSPQEQTRTTTIYSTFPKPPAALPMRKLPPIPLYMESKRDSKPDSSEGGDIPMRPLPPAEALLSPCIRKTEFFPLDVAAPESSSEKDTALESTTPPKSSRPLTSHHTRLRDSGETAPSDRPATCTIYSVVSTSTSHLPIPEIQPSPPRTARHHKSVAALSSAPIDQEPRSFFEDDTDDEEDPFRKFFSFHKRSKSDQKQKHNRSSSTTPTPSEDEARLHVLQNKRHTDVFGRMLGRSR